MIGDIITPAQRLSRLSPNRWEHRLSLLFFVIAMLLCLALMCENVNAAPQVSLLARMGREAEADSRQVESATSARANPAVAAPFILSHPICPTGFWISQRYDTRNAAGAIIKSVWVRKCTNGRIVYGRKV